MGRKKQGALPAATAELRDRITWWRRTREKRSPMPADLWDDAVCLARTHGTYATARALGVGYESLQRRVAADPSGADIEVMGGGEAGGRGFVEVSGVQLLGASTPMGTVVELTDPDGVRLTIRLGTGEKLDVAGLVHGFWRRDA